jgi:zinc transport system substrate-binding protein
MKQLCLIFSLIILILAGCKDAPAQQEAVEKPLILTSIYPYELMVRQMVGDAIEVRSMIPPAASVHNFSPQPSDLKDLHKADLIITNGMGLESMFAQSLNTLADKHIVVAELLRDAIALDSLNQVRDQLMHHHEEEEEHHGEEGHHHVGADPHLWTSAQMLLKLSTKLKNELVERFSDYAPLITHNYEDLQVELKQAHEQILRERAEYHNPALVTYHNSFYYFTRDYEINYLGWVQSSPGKEPSARELADLGSKIQKHQLKGIFIEPQQNPKSAAVLAREYKLEVFTLDPIGSTLDANTVAEVVLANWNSMKQAF